MKPVKKEHTDYSKAMIGYLDSLSPENWIYLTVEDDMGGNQTMQIKKQGKVKDLPEDLKRYIAAEVPAEAEVLVGVESSDNIQDDTPAAFVATRSLVPKGELYNVHTLMSQLSESYWTQQVKHFEGVHAQKMFEYADSAE